MADVVLQFLYRVRICFVYRTFRVSSETLEMYGIRIKSAHDTELKDNISHADVAIKITMLHPVYLNTVTVLM